eukprot:gene13737-biopygen10424
MRVQMQKAPCKCERKCKRSLANASASSEDRVHCSCTALARHLHSICTATAVAQQLHSTCMAAAQHLQGICTLHRSSDRLHGCHGNRLKCSDSVTVPVLAEVVPIVAGVAAVAEEAVEPPPRRRAPSHAATPHPGEGDEKATGRRTAAVAPCTAYSQTAAEGNSEGRGGERIALGSGVACVGVVARPPADVPLPQCMRRPSGGLQQLRQQLEAEVDPGVYPTVVAVVANVVSL